MFGRMDHIVAPFADQFAADGEDFVYRKGQRGAPIRVTAVEREQFLAAFRRRINRSMALTLAVTVVMILLLIWLKPDPAARNAAVMAMFLVSAIMIGWMSLRAWAAPARALAHRPTLGDAPTAEEIRRNNLASISYGRLALSVPISAFIIWSQFLHGRPAMGLEWIWLVAGVGLMVLAAVQAFRKWRMERGA